MTTAARLESVFRTVFDDDSLQLTDAMTAADVDDWDSLANINLMFAIESEFGIQFREDEFSFADVGELRRHLEDRLGP